MKKRFSVLLFLIIAGHFFAQGALRSPRRESPQPDNIVVQPQVAQPQSAQPEPALPQATKPQTTQMRTAAMGKIPALAVLIADTNRMMEIYAKFKPGKVVFHSLKDLQFKSAEITKIQSDPYLANFLSDNKDSIAVFAAVELFQDKISANLRQIVSHSDFMFKQDKRKTLADLQDISVAMSDDSRLYNFTFDSKHGSTYEMRTSVMHYIRPGNAGGNAEEQNPEHASKIAPAYQGLTLDGYRDIFLMNKEKAQYLLLGQVKSDINSYEYYADLASVQNNVFVKDFEFRIQSNRPEGCIVFDRKAKTLTVRYATGNSTCNCVHRINMDEKLRAQAKTCECVFAFNGTTFVKQ